MCMAHVMAYSAMEVRLYVVGAHAQQERGGRVTVKSRWLSAPKLHRCNKAKCAWAGKSPPRPLTGKRQEPSRHCCWPALQ
jgi:hypothetical protein